MNPTALARPCWIHLVGHVGREYDEAGANSLLKCDLCDKPAVVHEVIVKSGVKKEVHLCEEHAAEHGMPAISTPQPLNKMLTHFVIAQGQDAASKARASRKVACPGCGLTFSRFRQCGTLGCSQCYQAFEKQLAPLIGRSQAGATHHTGKTPRRGGGSIDREAQVRALLRELDNAVAAEQFERAAEVRDRLRMLEERAAQVGPLPPDVSGDDPPAGT